VIDIAETIISVLGRGSLNHVEWPDERKRIEIDDVHISSALLRKITGWKPKYDFRQGLERTKEVLELEATLSRRV
jgi:nucleoside-diphosphate-sugar epimerase